MEHGIKMALSFQRGEQEGFEYFFNTLYGKLVFFSWKWTQDEDASKDIVEHSFLKIWEKRETFTHHKVIEDYLFVIVKNECIRLFNTNNRINSKQEELIKYEIQRLSTSEADHTLIKSETRAIVHNWLSRLPKDCKTIMKLMYVDGLSSREIANHLELNISTVKNQKARGLEIIKSIAVGKPVRRKDIIRPPSKIVILKQSDKSVPEPKVEEKPKFIPWRKKGRPKEECVWKPNERNEKIYTMFKDGRSYQELSEIFDLCLQVIANIVRDEHKSIRVKELFIKGKRVMDIPRVVKISLKETIERINHLFKIELHEDNNRQCLATYKAIIKDYPHLQEKERVGNTGCPEAQYGSFA